MIRSVSFFILLFSCILFSCNNGNGNQPRRHKVGDHLEGGIVYWLDGTGAHGLIADTISLRSSNWSDAVMACQNRGTGWHLPNKDELHLLYLNRLAIVGVLSTNLYWSSSGSGGHAWIEWFNNGEQDFVISNGSTIYGVHAVHTF